MTKEELAVGPAVLVELDSGKEAQVVEVEVVVDVLRPGQLVAVGLHSVMVTVLVSVWVDVVVMSPSSAPPVAMERPAKARTEMMLLNCIVTGFFVECLSSRRIVNVTRGGLWGRFEEEGSTNLKKW